MCAEAWILGRSAGQPPPSSSAVGLGEVADRDA